MHDLLHDPLIGIRTRAGEAEVCLPDLLARLCAGEVEGYTGLRPHQADPWHVFLVQIAASVLARNPGVDPALPPADADFWRAGLLDLAEGQASAWELVVEDVTKPAFMQHPIAGGEAELADAFRSIVEAPDKLDVLLTAKNHDVKATRDASQDAVGWLFALLTNQTMRSYAIHYKGIVRMNSGTGSRPVVSLVADPSHSGRFLEELPIVLADRSAVLDESYGYRPRGCVLTWLRPWDRSDRQWSIDELEPLFVESAQPLRLRSPAEKLIAVSASGYARQIGPHSNTAGVLGDPWTPIEINRKTGAEAALTLGQAGWSPRVLRSLLFHDQVVPRVLQKVRTGNGELTLVASALVRDRRENRTYGYHTVRLRVPGRARASLLARESTERLGRFSNDMLAQMQQAGDALNQSLRVLAAAQQPGTKKSISRDSVLSTWAATLEREVVAAWNDRFFPTLWRATEPEDRDAVKAEWKAGLVADVRRALQDAEQRLPMPSARRWRAVTQARGLLDALLRKAALLPERDTPAEPQEAEEQAQ